MISSKIFFHELNDKFLNIESLSRKVDRILFLGEKYDAKFTFFVTAANLNPENISLLKKIVDAKHEIGSHSYQHINFERIGRQEARHQIQRSLEVLKKYTSIKGFRAPYLKANKRVAAACKECGLVYQSSGPGNMPEQYNGLWHIPVTQPMDYEVIQIEGITETEKIGSRWVSFAGQGQVLLFHPWRLGARKYIIYLERILQVNCQFSTMTDFLTNFSRCCVTFDLDFLQTRQVYFHTFKHLFYSPHLYNRK